jgi:hypothetical protein
MVAAVSLRASAGVSGVPRRPNRNHPTAIGKPARGPAGKIVADRPNKELALRRGI